jgi:fructokinase
MTNTHYIGIDMGGTKTEIILLDNKGGELFRKRVLNALDLQGNVQNVVALIAEARTHTTHPTTIGIGMPGIISPETNEIKRSTLPWLANSSFVSDIEQATGTQVRIQNDAKCFALAEAIDGAGAPYKTAFYVILGTGAGGAFVIDKRLYCGQENAAGEWGQLSFLFRDDQRELGQYFFTDTITSLTITNEQVIAGPALERFYCAYAGKKLSATEIGLAAAQGDTDALFILDTWADLLAQALSRITNLLMLEAVIIAGGLSQIPQLYTLLPQKMARYAYMGIVPSIIPAQFGDSSGVRGAAFLWKG